MTVVNRQVVLWSVLILLAGGAAYHNALRGVMLFDDYRGILENPRVRSFPDVLTGTTRPLTAFTFYLNVRAGGMAPRGFLAVNIAIHLANGLLVLAVLRALASALPDGTGAAASHRTRTVTLPGVVALLWTVHPLTTEAVSFIVQRGESLMASFLLISVWGLLAYRRGGPDRRAWAALSVGACMLGMLAKPVLVTAPVLMLLMDAVLSKRSPLAVWRRRKRYYTCLAAALIPALLMLLLPHESAGSVGWRPALPGPWAYLVTQAGVIPHYLRLSLLPTGLCLDYDWPVTAVSANLLLRAALTIILLVVTVALFRRRSPLALAGLWFFLLLAPTSSLIPLADAAAERRMYLPLVAVLAVLAWGGAALLRRAADDRPAARPALRGVAVIAVLAATVWLGQGTRQRNRDYHSAERMWLRVLQVAPGNPRARAGLAAELLRQKRHDEAEPLVADVLGVLRQRDLTVSGPDRTLYAFALGYMGTIRVRQQAFAEAEVLFREAYQVSPQHLQAGVMLAWLLASRQANAEARAILAEVLEKHPRLDSAREVLRQMDAARGGKGEG